MQGKEERDGGRQAVPALRPGAGPPIQGTSRARRDGHTGPCSAAGHQTSSRQVDALHKPSWTPCSGFRSHSGSDVTVHIRENRSLNFVFTFLALGFENVSAEFHGAPPGAPESISFLPWPRPRPRS